MAQDSGPFRLCTPSAPLSEFVEFFWIYEQYDPPFPRERLLPTGTMDLVFTMDAGGRSASGVAGPRSQFLALETVRPFSAIAVHFRPGGGFPFFGIPSCDLHNLNLTLDTVWGRNAASVGDRLWEAETPEQRFRILERTLLDRACGRFRRDPAVRYGLRLFDRSNGACRIKEVVQRVGLSRRRFVELFRSEVGLPPKAFCRIRRFNEVLRRIEHLSDVDWGGVALSCGYFDQAHFNHDFRAFSGLSPSNYLRHRITRTHVGDTEQSNHSLGRPRT